MKLSKNRVITLVVMTAIILGALTLSLFWLKNKPRAKRTAPKVLAPLVLATELKSISHKVVVEALGKVQPAQSVDLSSQVSGEVVSVKTPLVPGMRLKKGEFIAQIEPADYTLTLRQKEADLVKAEYELALERGQQAVAKREYKLLGTKIAKKDRTLVLREPHLKFAQAKVDAAKAAVEQAKLNLERTKIVSPFPAIVQERYVAEGMQVNSGSKIVTLVDSSRYWVEVSLNTEALPWVSISNEVSIKPRISGQVLPKGYVKSIKSDVETQGRMARIVVEVPNPLDTTKGAPLLLEDIVTVMLSGRELKNVIRIPRSALHEQNSLWLLTPDNTLKIETVQQVWSDQSAIYVPRDSLDLANHLIISNIPAPVDGMKLRKNGAK